MNNDSLYNRKINQPVPIDLRELENLYAENRSKKEIAAHFGLKASSLRHRLAWSLSLKGAKLRGVERRGK